MSRRDKTIDSVMTNVTNISLDISKISNELVNKYCKCLDDTIDGIRIILNTASSTDIDNDMLENFILKVSSDLYFIGSAQEDLGIKEDTCKAIRQEIYNDVRAKAQGTVADKDMAATIASQVETITLSIYSRAYKKVKLRIEAGYEMLNSLKKVMNRRINELELSQSKYIGGQQK